MYEIIKNVILNNSYILEDILVKIDIMWIKSSITDEQKDELIQIARDNADITNSINIIEKLKEHEDRLIKLEQGSFEPNPDIEEYIPGKWYYKGNHVMFENEEYECITPDGQVCTWSPKEYPQYWKKVTK